MGFKFYFNILFSLLTSFFILFIIGFGIAQINQVKEKRKAFKNSIKLEALIHINFLNKKLVFLEDDMNSSLKQQQLSTDISKILVYDTKLNSKVYPQEEEDQDLLEILNINDKKLFLSPKIFYFEKIKWKNKTHVILIKKEESQIILTFLNPSFFKNLQQKKQNISFSTFNKNQDKFFYTMKPQDLSKKNISKFIDFFLKESSSKHITLKSKRQKKQIFYYLQEWEGTNLLFVIKKEISFNFFEFLFISGKQYYVLFFFLLAFLFSSLFLFYSKFSFIVQAYSFLKTAFISFSEFNRFPKSPSKNPLLFFYRNREELLNELSKKENLEEEKESRLQEFLKKEIKKFKSRYPKLVIKEDFQTDVKLFGFKRFFKTIINELLLNAIESMGTREKQKIDISVKKEKNFLVLMIKDYGIGLEDTEKAFQMYHSTKSQLGEGLNLVQSIVVANQGEIELISNPGKKGVKAIVRLPLSCFLK
ncbi:MAG: sensor histidine kinase [Bdellovibrionales bacterium]|nr:sensor histidine kinase [Bdellovibrionales bacterium]